MKKEFIQSIKIITLSLVIGLGVSVVYADWVAPLFSAPTCNSGDPGCDAPINVGSTDQKKAGGLAIGTTDNPGAGQIYTAMGGFHKGLSVFTRTTNDYPALEIGDSISNAYPKVKIYRFASTANNMGTWGVNNTGVTYPAAVCADTDGTLILCPAPSGTVDLVLSETSYNQQYTNVSAPSASRSATLTWTVPSGASCIVGNQTETPAGTVTGWPVGYTINSSGSASVTFTRYGASTLSMTCDYGGGTPSDTVTYNYNGTDTFTVDGNFVVPTAVTSMTFKAVGGGGGGANLMATCADPYCEVISESGTNTVINYTSGATLDFTANSGGGATTCKEGVTSPDCPAAYNAHGTNGSGSNANGATVYNGTSTTSGGSSIGLSTYGIGGDGGYNGGGGAGISVTKTVAAGYTFNITVGQGGDDTGPVPNHDGGNGVAQFSW